MSAALFLGAGARAPLIFKQKSGRGAALTFNQKERWERERERRSVLSEGARARVPLHFPTKERERERRSILNEGARARAPLYFERRSESASAALFLNEGARSLIHPLFLYFFR